MKNLAQTNINRLSIGVQSFFDKDLQWMNRSHNAHQAISSLKMAQDFGFTNLNLDLIYGSPTTSDAMWEKNLENWLELEIPHLSAYSLTVEANTALDKMIEQNKVTKPQEDQAVNQFEYLMNFAENHSVNHYEISNFCRDENYALHNTNYWKGKAYFGFGPSAHSYDGRQKRKWNINHNLNYMKALSKGNQCFEEESLSENERMNEFLLTNLRAKWGIDQNSWLKNFGQNSWNQLTKALKKEIRNGMIELKDDTYILSKKGKFLADRIIGQLFFV